MKPIKVALPLIIFIGFLSHLSLSRLFPFPGSDIVFAFITCIAVIVVSVIFLNNQSRHIDNLFLQLAGKTDLEGFDEVSGYLINQVRENREFRGKISDTLSELGTINLKIDEETSANLSDIINSMADTISNLKNAIYKHAAEINDISSNINTTNKYAEETAEKTMESAEILSASSSKIKEMLGAIEASNNEILRLEEITKEIEKSTGMIDDIADQTNLLALNAAIEAARAGEAGRGFSIVADEVRKLAEHSSRATKEIISKIHAIRKAVSLSFEKLESVSAAAHEVNASTKKASMGASTVMGAISNLEDQISSINNTLVQFKESMDLIDGLTENCGNSVASSRQTFDRTRQHLSEINTIINKINHLDTH